MTTDTAATVHECPTGYHDEPSRGCYTTHKCRCEECREAATEYMREWKNGSKREPPEHGTYSGYTNWDCRCDDCKEANAAYMKAYRSQPEVKEYDRLQGEAYAAAQARLREAHRAEFERIYSEERVSRGLAPARSSDGLLIPVPHQDDHP